MGLVIFNVVPTKPTVVMYEVGVAVNVGRLAFCAACAGTARGTKNSIPDSASNASIVPELNFVKYIEDVFIIFERGRWESVYKEGGRIIYNLGDSSLKWAYFRRRASFKGPKNRNNRFLTSKVS